jgi:diaminopimelate decarboxylase
VIEEYFLRDGVFSADGVGIEEIVSSFGTPCYLYSARVIDDKYEKITSRFPGFEIFYSFKANPSLAICRRLLSLGASADISSLGELETALAAGFEPRNIAFVGPGKTEQEIDAAVRAGIYAIAAESAQELELIESVSRRLSKRTDVLLRINTLEEPVSPEMMVGGPSKFGFDEETVVDQVGRLRLESARLIGIHVYSASQVLDSAFISGHIDYVADLAARLSEELGFELRCIDFGGGFGVPYEKGQTELDLVPISNAAADVKRRLEEKAPGCRLIFEVGRYLVAESGVFITRVLRVKESRGTSYVITDGGMNHFSRPVVMGVDHPTRILNKMALKGDTRCSIGGPICTPIDLLGKDTLLPRPLPGDIVGIFHAGAYGYTMSMINFMSLGAPAEVLAHAGKLHLLRKSRPAGYVLEGQMIPEQAGPPGPGIDIP